MGNEIPLIFIRELDDYYLSFIYNLGEAFEIDYFFEKYKKIKLEVYTRDIWNITIEVKKIVESEVSYPIIKRYKGDYNPLECSCDRGDFIDFLYLLDHLEEKMMSIIIRQYPFGMILRNLILKRLKSY